MAPNDVPIQNLPIHATRPSSAFDNVPTETIVEIFHYCLPTYPLEHRQPDTKIAPMLLCQISSLWRSIALNTPSLWIYLNHVGYVTDQDLSTAPKAIWPTQTAFLRWWTKNLQSAHAVIHVDLERSKSYGRGQTLAGNLDSDIESVDDDVAFERLIRNAQGLYLDPSMLILFWRRFGGVNLRFANLRSVFIDQKGISVVLRSDLQNELDAIPIRFSSNLKHFIKHGYIFHVPLYHRIHERIPWAALTHVSIRTLIATPNEWFTLVRCFSSLQVGEFHVQQCFDISAQPPSDFSIPESPVSLVHVKTLNLCVKNYPLDFNPLQNLSLPNLTRLSIYLTDTTLDSVRAIIQSCPRLEDLRLASVEICLDSPPNASTSRLWDGVPELRSLMVDVNAVVYDLEIEYAVHKLEEWMENLSQAWLDLKEAPVSFQRLLFTASKGADELLRIKSAMQAHCALLGLPSWVEVDVHRTIDRDWNLSREELRSWM